MYLVFLHFHHSSRLLVGALDGQHKIVESTHYLDMINGTYNETLAPVCRRDYGRTIPALKRLRSATRGDLVTHSPNVHLLRRSVCRSFAVAGHTAWNQLPADERSTDLVNSFKTTLKTLVFLSRRLNT